MKGFRSGTDQPSGEVHQSVTKSAWLSRRKLLTTMGSAAAVIGAQPFVLAQNSARPALPGASQASDAAPTPIPGGFNARDAFGPRFPDRFFHLFLPGVGTEPATIFNYQGMTAILNIHGTGLRTETDPETGTLVGETPHLPFATDVRFMQGTYVGIDGLQHQGTFAFF